MKKVRPGVRIVGVDDGPFPRSHRGDIPVACVVYRGGTQLDGMIATKIRRDGRNATERLATAIAGSRYLPQLHYVLLDGIALGGFNVVDIHELNSRTDLPVMAVMRRRPDLAAVERAVSRLPAGGQRWALIQKAGPIEPCHGVYVQRAGLDLAEAEQVIALSATHAKLPEPLRAAHIIAGAMVTGEGGRRP